MTQKQEQSDTKRDPAPPPAPKRERIDTDEMERMRDEDPLFLEKTRPEDPSGRAGQQTRDNVNPAIPSGERGAPPNAGGIVDPRSLGMDVGGGVEPNYPKLEAADAPAPDQQTEAPHPTRWSINEPPGSSIGGGEGGTAPAETPVITSLEPDEATIGDETFDIFVHGTGFTDDSVIVFAGQDEPTDLEDDGTLSTGINMDVWAGPDTVKVAVKNGDKVSNEMDFTFHAEAAQRKAPTPAQKRKGKGVKAKSKSKR